MRRDIIGTATIEGKLGVELTLLNRTQDTITRNTRINVGIASNVAMMDSLKVIGVER